MNRGKFVFLESNTTGTGELLIRKALHKGFIPLFLTRDPKKYSFLPLANVECKVLDSSSRDILFEDLSQIKNLAGIYSSSEYYIETASWLANKLGLVSANPQAIKLCRDKYALYKILNPSEIDNPKTDGVSKLSEAEKVLESCHFPVIIKPSNGSGSIGVRLCETKQDCLQHIYLLFQNSYPVVLIQEYIDGPEFSVETCSIADHHCLIGITKKYLGNPPYFVEAGHDFPATLLEEEIQQINSVVQKLLSTLKYSFGFSHIEFRIRNGKIVIIEVNPRLAGGMIPVLIEKATGYDLLDLLLELYSGHTINLQMLKHKQFAAIRHFIPNKSGLIKRFAFENSVSIDEVKLIKKEGDIFIPQGDFRDRAAYIIVSDVDAQRCKDKANEALQKFNIEIEAKNIEA